MSVKIQLKRTTASSWTSLNTILAIGEIGFETDTKKFKIGDGTTAWASLPYSITANLASGTLNDLGDVTITDATNGDFLRWNGTAWINDAVNLGSDTTGSFVQSLVAGTGVTLTNNSGENTTPTIAIGQAVGTSDSPTFVNVTASLTGNASTATTLQTSRTIELTGDVTGSASFNGSANASITATIAANSVTLGTDTTGSYVTSLVAGTGITLENNSGESATPTIAIGQSVGTGDSPTFVNVTASLTGNASTATTLQTSRNIAGQAFNGSANISIAPTDLTGVTSTAAEINILDGATLSTAELNFVDGVTSAIQTQIDTNAGNASTALTNHENDTTNIHGIADTSVLVTTTGTQTLTNKTITSPAGLVKGDVGLGNVDNTSDANKPVSTATQTALDLKSNLASPTFTGTLTANDLTVSGNLTVSGTTTSINTETVTVDDNVIVLNNNATGAPSVDAGIEVERGSSTNVKLLWNETSDKWQITADGSTYGNIVSTSDTETVSTAMVAESAITQGKIGDNSIVNAKINTNAGIVDTKLATISTAGKVSNSATTATNLDTANAIVARDANGAFSAGIITASLNGNAGSATVLQTSRNIAGQAFNGSANISIAPTDLTGVTATASEINVLDGITSSTAELNILDGVTADASELNILDGATLSTVELNYVDGVTSGIQTQIDAKAPIASPTFTGTVSGVTKTMVGLGNVDNTSDANKPISTATQTALDLKAPLANPTFTGTVSGVTASHVGLGNVNNTSDAEKPVSTATQTALNLKANLASPTFTGTPSLPTGTTAITQTLGNNTTALATTEFIQTALANFGGMTVSDTAPSSGVEAGDFWFNSTDLNLYIYYSNFWTQVTIDEPLFFDLSELTDVQIDENLLPNQTLRWNGQTGYWVNSAPRQSVANSSSASYSVIASDSGSLLKFNGSSATTVDLGSWSASVGEKVDVVQYGTGQVTITVSGGASMVSPNNSVTTRARYSLITVTCVASNTFLLSGDLT